MKLMRKYNFAVCNISQFYARPGESSCCLYWVAAILIDPPQKGTVAASPAWKSLRLDSATIKERSRRISDYFNNSIVNPHAAMVGTTIRVW